jgi:hypothetical protein
MRDYGPLYEKVLRNGDINTKVDVYPGLPHGILAMAPQAEFTKAWKEDKKRAWSWLLGQSCWNGFLHAPLGSLHILELGGIATRGL